VHPAAKRERKPLLQPEPSPAAALFYDLGAHVELRLLRRRREGKEYLLERGGIERLAEESVATCRARLLELLHSVAGHENDQAAAGARVLLQPSGRVDPAQNRHRDVHQDGVGPDAHRRLDPPGAVGLIGRAVPHRGERLGVQ
jgi:hypothetical protein